MTKAHEDQSHAMITLGPGVWIARGDADFTFSRAGGPGGQAVNKLNTRAQLRVPLRAIHGMDDGAIARLRHNAGRRLTQNDEIIIHGQTHRSQLDNKQECIVRLRELVSAALVKPKVRRKKKPTRAMIEKRLAGKRIRSQKKQSRRDKRLRDQ